MHSRYVARIIIRCIERSAPVERGDIIGPPFFVMHAKNLTRAPCPDSRVRAGNKEKTPFFLLDY
jgi:hypothetical protein